MTFAVLFSFYSCESNDEANFCEPSGQTQDSEIVQSLFEQNEYNLDLQDFTMAVRNAMCKSKDFRILIKKEALVKFDGDYDVLLSRIVDKPVAQYEGVQFRSTDECTVKDLLEDYYISNNPNAGSGLRANASSIISELSTKYPNLQVSVPVNAEKWDTNTIPVVTFIPIEYQDGVTKWVPGYNSDGSLTVIDAVIPPKDDPIIVIGQNERMDRVDVYCDTLPLSPKNLRATSTPSGISLLWDVENPDYAVGYKIYRKSAHSSNYSLYTINNGNLNIGFTDIYLVYDESYYYYVTAYNSKGESTKSNTVSAIAPSKSKAPLTFAAILNTNKEVELRWTTGQSGYIDKLQLYRYILNQTSGYNLYKEFDRNTSDWFDRDIAQGKTIRYKLQTATPVGVSDPLYDIVKIPYRNPSLPSPIRIKNINCSDNVEGFLMGTPELTLKICGVDAERKTTEIRTLYFDMNEYNQNFNEWVLDWMPDSWYQIYTFYLVEEDPGKDTNISIKANIGIKKKIADGVDIGFEAGISREFKFSSPEDIGWTELNYYDPINTVLKFKNSIYWCDITLGQ
jgi:hypothetical protein